MATHHLGSQDEKLIDAVEKGHISDATKALVAGADPNSRYRGRSRHHLVYDDTALHIAARNGNILLVKLLIVFDANLRLKNQNGKTPSEVAHSSCREIIEKVLKLRKNLEARPRKTAKPPPKPDDDDVFLLCLDGGGIRGLVFIQAVIELDKRREQLYPGSKPFLSYFNWIAGNSTGGIAALALAIGKSPINGRQMYFELKDSVLGGKLPFSNGQVDKVMKDTFQDKVMSDIKEYNVAVMTTLADTLPPKLHIMRTYGGPPDDGQKGPDERRIWEAARATSAAVPYFHPFGKFIDGGFIANNPTVDALVDMQSYFTKKQRKANVKAVISLGCGYVPPEPFSIDQHNADIDPELLRILALDSTDRRVVEWLMKEDSEELVQPPVIFEGGPPATELNEAFSMEYDFRELALANELMTTKMGFWFLLKNVRTIWNTLKLCISQTTQPSGEVVARGEAFAKAIGAKYSRVNPKIKNVDFIETDDKKLIEMLYTTVLYMLENHTKKMDQVLAAVMEN